MPTTLPQGFGDETVSGESNGSYVEIRGIFPATIYNIKPGSKAQQNGPDLHNYSIDFRIDGGDFDGEDVNAWVGLYSKTIFTLHDILVALGELDNYYQKGEGDAKGRWVALPEPADLQGKKLFIQVDNAPWQSTEREDRDMGVVDANGKPVLRDGNAIVAFYPIDKPAPAYRPRPRKERLAKKQPTGAVPSTVGAGTAAQDVWGGSTAQQGGTSAW